MSEPETDRRTMPAAAAVAANALLDAIISQTGDRDAQQNAASMEMALSRLVGAENDDDALIPDAAEIALSSVVCLSWLAARLAQATGSELEIVVADLRDFIDSVRVV